MTTPTEAEWRTAACAGKDTELWYSDQENDRKIAKTICASCPIRVGCLEEAYLVDEEYGIFGGLLPRERNSAQAQGVAPADTRVIIPRYTGRWPADPNLFGLCGHPKTDDNSIRRGFKPDGSRRLACRRCQMLNRTDAA